LHGYVALVVPVRTPDGTPAVLKISWLDPESAPEPAALAAWAGHGAVRGYEAAPAVWNRWGTRTPRSPTSSPAGWSGCPAEHVAVSADRTHKSAGQRPAGGGWSGLSRVVPGRANRPHTLANRPYGHEPAVPGVGPGEGRGYVLGAITRHFDSCRTA